MDVCQEESADADGVNVHSARSGEGAAGRAGSREGASYHAAEALSSALSCIIGRFIERLENKWTLRHCCLHAGHPALV